MKLRFPIRTFLAHRIFNYPLKISILTKKRVIKVAMVHAGIPRDMSLKKAETLSRLCELELVNNPTKSLKNIFENKKKFYDVNSFSGLVNFFTRVRVINKTGIPDFSFKGKKKNIPSFLNPAARTDFFVLSLLNKVIPHNLLNPNFSKTYFFKHS